MAHLCEAALVTCEDFRLHQRADGSNFIAETIHSLGVDCDLITRGGCIQDLVRPKEGFDNSLLRDLNVSVNLHQVKTIYLVGHEDCGAYGHFQFNSRDIELKQHYDDLFAAREILTREFPGVDIQLRFAELEPGTDDRWVIVEIK